MSPGDVVNEEYDVVLIDDVRSFLTPRLVELARRDGRMVVGVFDPGDGADAKRRLLDDVIDSDATPEEFVVFADRLHSLTPHARASRSFPWSSWAIVAVGTPPGGCGATKVAIALAGSLRQVLVDCDDVAPSIAHRLGLALHPNLRTAIHLVHCRDGPAMKRKNPLSGGVRVRATPIPK
ncbi:hypothetical protein BH23ACT5_BH23ACT5_23550 [soil metagenome]